LRRCHGTTGARRRFRQRHRRVQPHLRLPGEPQLINFYLDGGIVFSGMVPGRADDKFGAAFIYSNISPDARALDRDNTSSIRMAISRIPRCRRARSGTRRSSASAR
jgi:hypothetical protein